MTWNFALQMAKTEADKYALRGGKHPEGTEVYSIRFNAFLEGYMQNAGERESLRAILKSKEKTTLTDKAPSLDELV